MSLGQYTGSLKNTFVRYLDLFRYQFRKICHPEKDREKQRCRGDKAKYIWLRWQGAIHWKDK